MTGRYPTDPPATCHVGAVWRHKTGHRFGRIQRVYFDLEHSMQWRVVLAGGREFSPPGARAVPNAMPLEGFLEHWAYERD